MEQSLVLLDLDGTLLNSDKKILDSTKTAIQKLKNNGHIPAIATGRTPVMFKYVLEELGIHTYISLNGNYVVFEDEVIFKNPLDRNALKHFTKEAMNNNHPLVYLNHEGMHSNLPSHDYYDESFNSLKIDKAPKYNPDFYLDEEVFQTLLFCEAGEETLYQKKYNNDFNILRWHPVSCDVTPQGSSKALGIQKLIEYVNVPVERIYAFGDGPNDFEMIDMVGVGIVMENGLEDLKSRASFITKSCDDNGIEYGLKEAGLIK